MRNRRRIRTGGATVIIFIFLFIVAAASAGFLGWSLFNSQRDMAAMKVQLENESSENQAKLDELTESVHRLEAERDELKVKAAELETRRAELEATYAKGDERYDELLGQIEELSKQISERDNEIEILNNSIATLEQSYSVDINAQLDVIKTLEEMLIDVPELKVEITETSHDGKVKKRIEKRTPTIALYYEDIENGYKYSYRGDEIYDSASCIKAPYALSLLKAAENEIASLPEGTDLSSAELFYNFTGNSITYTNDMEVSGSGKIKDKDVGTKYTHLELIEYMLMYSDNVAYDQLKKAYGIDDFRNLVYEYGLTSMRKSLSDMSVSDGGRIMRAIYDYIEGGSLYSEFMYNSMVNSTHTVMIGYAVRPSKTVHKYGWDTGAYHDMAIVYDEHPYILVIMTDMDTGGDEVNEYIQSVVKQVGVLHDNFYSSGLNK